MHPQLSNEHGPDQLSSISAIGTTPNSALSELSVPPASASYSGSCHEIYNSNFDPELALDAFLPQATLPAYPNLNSFPAFFEQVMLPSVEMGATSHETQQPRGVFDFMLDTDFSFSENDLFGTDFIPDLDRILDNTPTLPGFENVQDPQLDDHESASRRAEAFQRSFWCVLRMS